MEERNQRRARRRHLDPSPLPCHDNERAHGPSTHPLPSA